MWKGAFFVEALKQRIQRDGKIRGNNEVLKVDSFLNHQMDVAFLEEIGREFRQIGRASCRERV